MVHRFTLLSTSTLAFVFLTAILPNKVAIAGLCSNFEDCGKDPCYCGTGYYCSYVELADASYCKKLTIPSTPSTPSSPSLSTPSGSPPSYKSPTDYETPTKTKGFRCFPGSSLLHIEDSEEMKRIDDVSVGDSVASVDEDGNLEYSPIVYIPHLKNEESSDFVEITCERISTVQEEDVTKVGGPSIVIRATDKHILFTSEKKDSASFCDAKTIPAGKVKVGLWMHAIPADVLMHSEEKVISANACLVTEVKKVVEDDSGIYTVFTKNGRVLVNGIAASSYVGDEWILGEDHKGAHSLTWMHRMMYELGMAESKFFRYFNDCLNSVYAMF